MDIKTIKNVKGNEVSILPERGGIITSLILHGTEILYLDESTINIEGVSVRGGIPILFPNAGAVESELFPSLKQHGFVRDSTDWKIEKNNNGFVETLPSTDETKKFFPYDFLFSIRGKFEENGSFTIKQEVINMDENKRLPISMGLHPYFKAPNNEKSNIKFNFEGGKSIEEQANKWMNGQYVSIDNPKAQDPSAIIEVIIPTVGTLMIDASEKYQKIWIWSLPDKDFICIEPVMRDVGGLVNDPQILEPKEVFITSVNFNLEK